MKFFEVTYYIDRLPCTYDFTFESAFGAIHTARAIFEPNNTYIDERYLQDGAIIEMR